ncbi:hypothetical protein P9H32_11365 [Pontiella sp. NLcol2]|uniref:Uncharacterized protein n=1 Tax=Pontiella agarivorans TaxID=3038953 RepID=A0ABU5MYH4_9BACT|nr:hypothetical protein [Pontiella agarivorans]
MKSILYKLVLFLLFTCPSHACYQAEQGCWLNRDPIEEQGEDDIYSFGDNSIVSSVDILGMIQWYENYGGPSAAFTSTNRVTPNEGSPRRPRILGRPF